MWMKYKWILNIRFRAIGTMVQLVQLVKSIGGNVDSMAIVPKWPINTIKTIVTIGIIGLTPMEVALVIVTNEDNDPIVATQFQ